MPIREEDRYNGWANYETWLVNLWVDNDEEAQERWRVEATELLAHAPEALSFKRYGAFDSESLVAGAHEAELADRLRKAFEDEAPDLGAGLWADLLAGAVSEVHWREIATNMIDEAKRELEAQA